MVLYVMVTKDKYELPLIVARTIYEMAEMANVSPSSVSRSTKLKNGQFKKVKIED